MSQFTFLQREWAMVFEAAAKAEDAVHADPQTACFQPPHLIGRTPNLFLKLWSCAP